MSVCLAKEHEKKWNFSSQSLFAVAIDRFTTLLTWYSITWCLKLVDGGWTTQVLERHIKTDRNFDDDNELNDFICNLLDTLKTLLQESFLLSFLLRYNTTLIADHWRKKCIN